jgi:hypothetical protein
LISYLVFTFTFCRYKFIGFYSNFFGTPEAEMSTKSLEDIKHVGFLDKTN